MHIADRYILKLFSVILFVLVCAGGRSVTAAEAVCASAPNCSVLLQCKGHINAKSAVCQAMPDSTPSDNHIRVRYKASYCECTLTPLFVIHRLFFKAEDRNYASYYCQLVFRGRYASRLRGPPVFVA